MMMCKKVTNKEITLGVLVGHYHANIGTEKEHLCSEWLCDAISLEMVNTREVIEDVRYNLRRSIESICWGAFLNHANNLIRWEAGENYQASSTHLKAFIKNDYSVLNALYEEMREEREEAQLEIQEQKEAEKEAKKIKVTKKQVEKMFKDSNADFLREHRHDSVAKKEAWSCFVDTLNKDGLVTDEQANNWLYPQFCE